MRLNLHHSCQLEPARQYSRTERCCGKHFGNGMQGGSQLCLFVDEDQIRVCSETRRLEDGWRQQMIERKSV
jgi:hypothetical protein